MKIQANIYVRLGLACEHIIAEFSIDVSGK